MTSLTMQLARVDHVIKTYIICIPKKNLRILSRILNEVGVVLVGWVNLIKTKSPLYFQMKSPQIYNPLLCPWRIIAIYLQNV